MALPVSVPVSIHKLLLLLFFMLVTVNCFTHALLSRRTFSVDSYGAKADGINDDSQAFLKAWADACATSSRRSIVLDVPPGKTYVLQPLTFKGPCQHRIIFSIQGTILAPANPSQWKHSDGKSWIQFNYIENCTINGGGIIDGVGKPFWDCKLAKGQGCQTNPNALTFNFAKNVKLRNLWIRNSPQAHIVLHSVTGIEIRRIRLESPDESPNTDGIVVGYSSNILISSSALGVGDDCVGIVSGTSNLYIGNVRCGPGHGISVGSLGRNNEKIVPVTNITVVNSYFDNTTNGIRIKTWQGGQGIASNMLFEGLLMNNVHIPINIDQFYCADSVCSNQTSAVQIKDITFRDITGTSTVEPLRLACSSTVPCVNVNLQNVRIRGANKRVSSRIACNNIYGRISGIVSPAIPCLKPN